MVVFLFWVRINEGGGGTDSDPPQSVQVTQLLTEIGVPSIISQKNATLARS